MGWYCNRDNVETKERDVDTLYLEYDGMAPAQVCPVCKDHWFFEREVLGLAQSEADAEAKMA